MISSRTIIQLQQGFDLHLACQSLYVCKLSCIKTDCTQEIDWYYQQHVSQDQPQFTVTENTQVYGYGFNCRKTAVFTNLLDEFGQLLDVKGRRRSH